MSRRCLNCAIALVDPHPGRQITDLSEIRVEILERWLSPTPVSEDDYICRECNLLIVRQTDGFLRGIAPRQKFGNESVCLSCGSRIVYRDRSRLISLECPARRYLLPNIPPHQVYRLERVCISCYSNAISTYVTNLKLERGQLVAQHLGVPSNRNVVDITALPVTPPMPPRPPPLPPSGLLDPPSQAVRSPKIISDIYKRAAASSQQCIFSNCHSDERLLVPSHVKETLLMKYNLYVPRSARICGLHIFQGAWDQLSFHDNDFTQMQLDEMRTTIDRCFRREIWHMYERYAYDSLG